MVLVGRAQKATSRDDIRVEASGSESRTTDDARITFASQARLADPLLQRVFERLGDQVVIRMTTALRRHASSAASG